MRSTSPHSLRLFRLNRLPSALLTALLIWLLQPMSLQAAPPAVAVLLSREIAPYIAMVEGLESTLGDFEVQRFFLDAQGRPYSLAGASPRLDPRQFAARIAVGPEALRYLDAQPSHSPVLFGMVLHPAALLKQPQTPLNGVDLHLPVEHQFAALRQRLPHLRRLGVLFDPANNQSWFEQARPIAAALGFELLPLQVTRQSGVLDIPSGQTRPDAILFIPDRTIISRAVIQHVIKQAALQRVPVVGYNRFFLDSGAALAFLIDYPEVGRQVARRLRQTLLEQQPPVVEAPVFTLAVNLPVWRSIGLPEMEAQP